ncbi:MAG: SH3 domain-containing protein [Chloroflexota bacterium]
MKRSQSMILLLAIGLVLGCQITNLLTSLSPLATPTPTARPRATATELIAQVVAPPIEPSTAPPTEAPQPVTATITGDNLRVRAQPNTNAAIVDRLNKGDSAQIVGRTAANDWLQILRAQTPDTPGWISAQFAQVNGSLDAVPVVEPGQSSPRPTSPLAQPPAQPYPAPQPQLPPPPTSRPYP